MIPSSSLLRLLVGVVVTLPLVVLVGIVYPLLSMVVFHRAAVPVLPSGAVTLALLLLAPVNLGIMAWLIAIIVSARKPPSARQVVWAIVVLFAYIFTAPAAWYVFMWKAPASSRGEA